MDWQQVASLGIVAVTAVLLVRGQIRHRKHGAHNCADCAILKISREKSIIERQRSEVGNQKSEMVDYQSSDI